MLFLVNKLREKGIFVYTLFLLGKNIFMKLITQEIASEIENVIEVAKRQKNEIAINSLAILLRFVRDRERMEKLIHQKLYMDGGRSGYNASNGRDFMTFDEYYNEFYDHKSTQHEKKAKPPG